MSYATNTDVSSTTPNARAGSSIVRSRRARRADSLKTVNDIRPGQLWHLTFKQKICGSDDWLIIMVLRANDMTCFGTIVTRGGGSVASLWPLDNATKEWPIGRKHTPSAIQCVLISSDPESDPDT